MFEDYTFEITATSPENQWVKQYIINQNKFIPTCTDTTMKVYPIYNMNLKDECLHII